MTVVTGQPFVVENQLYHLTLFTPKGSLFLDNVIEGLQWQEGQGEFSVRCQFKAMQVDTPLGPLNEQLANGNKISIYAGQLGEMIEVFRGTIFMNELNAQEADDITVTAYDDLYFIMKSKSQRLVTDGTPALDTIKSLLTEFGLTINKAEGPVTKLPKVKLQGPVNDMFRQILGEAFYRGDGAFIFRMNYTESASKVDIIAPGQNTTIYLFDEMSMESVKDRQDITDLITQVRVFGEQVFTLPNTPADPEIIGSDDPTVRPPIDMTFTTNYRATLGNLQDIVVSSTNDTEEIVKTKAHNLLQEKGSPKRTRAIPIPDIPFIHRGDIHHFLGKGLDGFYLIAGITHDADSGRMVVTLDTSGSIDYQHLRLSADKTFMLPDAPPDPEIISP